MKRCPILLIWVGVGSLGAQIVSQPAEPVEFLRGWSQQWVGGLWGFDRATLTNPQPGPSQVMTLQLLFQEPPTCTVAGIPRADSDNRGELLLGSYGMYRFDLIGSEPGPRLSTLFSFPCQPRLSLQDWDLDQSGDLIVVLNYLGIPGAYGVFVVSRSGVVQRDLYFSQTASPRMVRVDIDTGDYILAFGRSLIRLNASDPRITTPLATSPTSYVWTDLVSDPRTGGFFALAPYSPFIPQSCPAGQLHHISASGAITTVSTCRMESQIRIDPLNGDLLIAGGGPSNPLGTYPPLPVYRYGRNGVLQTAYLTRASQMSNYVDTWFDVFRSRHLSGTGPATPGSTYNLFVSFPNQPGHPYLMAGSFSMRPGLQVGTRWVGLNPDPLFYWSLGDPSVFEGFSGVLDAQGEALARWHIPTGGGLVGWRAFFVVAITGGSNTVASEPIGVTIR